MRFMLRCLRPPAGAAILTLACAGAAGAQPFTGVVVFGDSLSDSGNAALTLGLPAGSSATTNPDPIAAEIIAEALGHPILPALTGGANFAWVGSCVNPAGPCLSLTPSVPAQVTQHLAQPGGRADPDALYSIWGGANDVIAAMVRDPAGAADHAAAAAVTYVRQIARLQAAGARYVVVYTLPDLGVAPLFASHPDSAALSGVTVRFNDVLADGLGTLDAGIVPIDVFGLFNEVRADPGRYDLTDAVRPACDPPNALTCGPAGAGLPGEWRPGTNASRLFADGLHPTGVGHAMIADVVLTTLAAPAAVSLAGEGGLRLAADHGVAVHREMMSDLIDPAARGLRGHVTVQYGEQDFALDSVIDDASARVVSVTVGANHRAGERIRWGAALSLGTHDNVADSVRLDTRAAIASLHAALRAGGGYLHGAVSGGVADVSIGRGVTLGQPSDFGFFPGLGGGAAGAALGGVTLGRAVRTETGSTTARQFGAEAGFGWLLGAPDGLRHGPFLGAVWLRQDVAGYREETGSATSMHFSGFDRGSLAGRVGYQLMAAPDYRDGDIRPFGRVAWRVETEDRRIFVTAGSNRLPGRFTTPGFAPPEEYWSADVGFTVSMGDRAAAGFAYTGRFSRRQGARYSLSAGAGLAF